MINNYVLYNTNIYDSRGGICMSAGRRILVIDDDINICELIRLYMEKENFEVLIANDGQSGLEEFKKSSPALIILDVMMPIMDGWQVLREVRKLGQTPVIMLSAKGETFDKVLGLELGADDYVVKPFEPKELIARAKAVLRRLEHKNYDTQEVVYPGLVINKTDYSVNINEQTVEMPPKELELLYFLAANPNKVYTREQLLENVWGFDFFGDSRTVDVHVKRLREKLEMPDANWQLKTVWGVGYKFEVK